MKHILIAFTLFTVFSCNKYIEPENPQVLFDKYKNSVVLVASQYYYKLNIDGYTFYYSPASEKKVFTSKEEILMNLSSSSGTGFAISKDGEIITNNHVVNHEDDNYIDEFIRYSEQEKNSALENRYSYEEKINNLEDEYNNSLHLEDPSRDFYKYSNEHSSLTSKKDSQIRIYHILNNISVYNSSAELINYKIGIAYTDSKESDFSDLQECVVVRRSEDKNVDLALLQTTNKTFNNQIENIFNFDDNNPNVTANPEKYTKRDISNPIKINEDVHMIGYNSGFFLAKTELGIKPQFTSGKISQECDGVRILYTIPTLGGSSGSPVIDKWGNLIDVHFAGINGSQGFNFAIPVYELLRFYKGYPVLSDVITE